MPHADEERGLVVAWREQAPAQRPWVQLGPYRLRNTPLRHHSAFNYFFSRISLTPEQDSALVLRGLRQLATVVYAEPDAPLQWQTQAMTVTAAAGTAPDQLQQINAERAWLVNDDCRDTLIAVIDTGIDLEHADLQGALWRNEGEIAEDGIDNDGNGYIDDVYGLNAIRNRMDQPVPSPDDDAGHGTHVAGIIAAAPGAAEGQVGGLCRQARLMPVKFLNNGSISDAIESIAYALDMGARVLNNSWTYGANSQSLLEALAAAQAQGALVVAAAGNQGRDIDGRIVLPAHAGRYFSNVIAVANVTADGALYDSSNYGRETVDIGAPGVNILSTWPGNQYRRESGTSMAAPLVSALGALVWQVRPELTAEQVKALMFAHAASHNALQGRLAHAGVIDAGKVLENIGQPPTWLFRLGYSESQGRYYVVGSDLQEASALQLRDSLSVAQAKPLAFELDGSGTLYFDLPADTRAAWLSVVTANGESNRLYLQQPLAPPQDIAVEVDEDVLLSWNAPANADRILVERAELDGLFQVMASLEAPVSAFRDTTVTTGTRYRYRLRAAYDYADPVTGQVRSQESATSDTVYANTDPAEQMLLTSVLGTAQLERPYSVQLATRETAAADAFTLYPGDRLPAGLSLSGSGLIEGIPQQEGRHAFTVLYRRADGWSEARTYELEVTARQPWVGGRIEHAGITYQVQSETAEALQLQARQLLESEREHGDAAVRGELIEVAALLAEGRQALELVLTPAGSGLGTIRTVSALRQDGHWVALDGDEGAQLTPHMLRWAVASGGQFDWSEEAARLQLKLRVDYQSPVASHARHQDLRCFIASAVYDDPQAPQLQALRDFRDQWLLTGALGRWLVARYYEYSPAIAVWLQGHPQLRALVRDWLDRFVGWLPEQGDA